MKIKTAIIAVSLALPSACSTDKEGNSNIFRRLATGLVTYSGTNRERVLARHPEARIQRHGQEWIIAIKPNCGPHARDWFEIGSDNLSEDTAWFTALEWLLAYDYC